MMEKTKSCVIGAGHGGMAMAGHLGVMGFEVNLFNRSPERIGAVQWRRGIDLDGEVEGFGSVKLATTDIKAAITGVKIIMVVVPANAHRVIAEIVAPYLQDGQIIILNPGRTCGVLEFFNVLKEKGCQAKIFLAETQIFLYASRAINPGQVHIFRIKNSGPLAALPAYHTPEVLEAIKEAFPQFVPGDNILKTSFDNIGAVFHPALTILNAAWIEDPEDFEFYFQGASHTVCHVLEAIDHERVAVTTGRKAVRWINSGLAARRSKRLDS